MNTKLISIVVVAASWMLASPAFATCGVNGYWGSECGTQPTTPAGTVLPGDNTNTLTGGDNTATGVGIGTGVGTGIGTGIGHGGAGGSSTATGGSVGDVTGGNSTSTATGGTGGSVAGSGNSSSDSSAVAGVSGSGNSSTTVNNTNKTRIKHAASMAAPVMMGGYGPGNCFGDTNPSGQFGASIQTFGWGVSANRSKASNVCAAYAIAGPQGAIGYLAQQDPSFRSVALANGWAIKKSEANRRKAKAADAPAQVKPRRTVTCPAGSAWDGKGCWAADLRKVRR